MAFVRKLRNGLASHPSPAREAKTLNKQTLKEIERKKEPSTLRSPLSLEALGPSIFVCVRDVFFLFFFLLKKKDDSNNQLMAFFSALFLEGECIN